MRVTIPAISAQQDGLFARWQFSAHDRDFPDDIDWARRTGLRAVFSGVCITGWAPVTWRQYLRAATLTAPDTALHAASAADLHAIRRHRGRIVSVVRPGNRGVNHSRNLRVAYSTTLDGEVVTVDGISVTCVERTLLDLWPHLAPTDRSRMLREALRIRATDPVCLLAWLHHRRRRPGATALRDEVLGRLQLPFDRCRSPAECFGLVVLDDAGVEIPVVNEKVAGVEADFIWFALRLIIEIDGPQWHRFKEEDARKTATWRAAGFRVERLSSDDLFADPQALLHLAPPSTRP